MIGMLPWTIVFTVGEGSIMWYYHGLPWSLLTNGGVVVLDNSCDITMDCSGLH